MKSTETPTIDVKNFENSLKCPVTLYYFLKPVILSSEYTVEEDTAKRLLAGNKPRCPISRKPLKNTYVFNRHAKSQVEEYLTKNPGKRKDQYGYKELEQKSDDPIFSEEQEQESGVRNENNVSAAGFLRLIE